MGEDLLTLQKNTGKRKELLPEQILHVNSYKLYLTFTFHVDQRGGGKRDREKEGERQRGEEKERERELV